MAFDYSHFLIFHQHQLRCHDVCKDFGMPIRRPKGVNSDRPEPRTWHLTPVSTYDSQKAAKIIYLEIQHLKYRDLPQEDHRVCLMELWKCECIDVRMAMLIVHRSRIDFYSNHQKLSGGSGASLEGK